MIFPRVLRTLLYSALILVYAGCASRITAPPVILPIVQAPAVTFMMPVDSLDFAYRNLKAYSLVIRFYKKRNYEPAWTSNELARRDSLITIIKNIGYFGLNSSAYDLDEINALRSDSVSASNMQRLDATLTDAVFCMARDLKYGRIGHVNPDSVGLPDFSSEDIANYFESVEPRSPGYKTLKLALKIKLDSLLDNDPSFKIEKVFLRTSTFDTKIQSLITNMERWRCEPLTSSDRYVLVNIPSYMLYVIENDSVVFESRVIVGKADTPTPELNSEIDCMITFPYWYVPRKIAVEEYLPAIQSDTSFLRKNNFDVLNKTGKILDADSIPWTSFNKNYFPVSLRQREGSENSLGIVKFVFDNPHAVFLHDTNAKRLFRNNARAFSHGCVRVEKAIELSHFLMTGTSGKTSTLIAKYLKDEQRRSIPLTKPISIYIRYFTADTQNGKIVFYSDIYGKDQSLTDLLFAGTEGL